MAKIKDAYYFSHDSNAKDDPKCVMLIEQLGLEGYGIYWVLIELLREQPEYKYPLSLISAIARRYNTTSEKMKTVIMSYELFNIENDEFFFSDSLMTRMEFFDTKREKARASINSRWNKVKELAADTNVLQTNYDSNTSKVKESKVKDSKDIPLFAEFWEIYPKKVAKKDAERAWKKVSLAEYPEIITSLEKWKLSNGWTKDGGQYIPNAATWLNGERWKDEAPESCKPYSGPTKTEGGTYKL